MNQSLKWRNVVSLLLSSALLGILRRPRPALSHCSTIAIIVIHSSKCR